MTAGRKRYRITIQRLKTDAEGVTRTASGHIDKSLAANWTAHAPRWARIESVSGREYQQEGQVHSEATHIVTIDFDSTTKTTTAEMRVSWNDAGTTRILDIARIDEPESSPGGRRRELALECKEHA